VYFCCGDGDHAYDVIKVDFHNCDSSLEVGGFWLFDDSIVADFGVGRLMPEVLKTKKYRLIGKNPRSKPPIQKENDEKGAPGPRPGTFWTQRQ